MTQNPFGEGGFDMGALLQQAQQMQQQLMEAQATLAETEVEGTVAGGAVTVTINGAGDLRAVRIAAGSFDGSDVDDLADLGDLVVAAFRDAKAKADALAQEKLNPLAGGLGGSGGLPGLPGFGQG
ncbi:YbaB/EbfC family nucleoid-associated protein [Nocardioides daejeonensis]|uniref:YbaB/EbfC family nucleoid-associated protein n=1 Tax=Nocardioides daejeonensis TaxID=1046556 RepID=UPI000D74D692|nr:YbaB/EbfC family nucleoid-associated protein [Nocardioides daejeonensis]